MFVVEFVPGAARQVAEARAWWHENREKAPTAFDEDLAELVSLLEHVPRAVGVAVSQRPGVRRVFLKRLRYYAYFTIDGSTVTVIAVWHGNRGSGPPLP